MAWGTYWDTPHPRRSTYRDTNQFDRDRDSRRYYQYAMGMPYSQSTQGSDGECQSCSQRSESNGSSYGGNDTCKRHRKKDDDEYSEKVVAYRRRKPKA